MMFSRYCCGILCSNLFTRLQFNLDTMKIPRRPLMCVCIVLCFIVLCFNCDSLYCVLFYCVSLYCVSLYCVFIVLTDFNVPLIFTAHLQLEKATPKE